MLLLGDCRDSMAFCLGENEVDAIVTDPPYELAFMGKKWDDTGVAFDPETWHQCLRVLKPGGHLLAFGGTRTYHRLVCAIEDGGFEIRDQLAWLFGQGFPKGTDKAKIPEAWSGWNTALKPGHEPICLARKPMEGTLAENLQRWGTGALWIDGCRIEVEDATDYQRNASGARGHAGTREAESTGATDIRAGGGNAHELGRWPANVLHDGSDEVVALFPQSAGQLAAVRPDSGTGNKTNGILGKFATNSDHTPRGDIGSAARFFYCAKASRTDRNEGCEKLEPRIAPDFDERPSGDFSKRMNRKRQPVVKTNHHPTVKPTDLMRYLCRLVTPPGGTILDPFMGSGSTGKAAVLDGFKFIGCELSPEYLTIAQARIAAAAARGPST